MGTPPTGHRMPHNESLKILVVGQGYLGNIIKESLAADITSLRIDEILDNKDYLIGYDVVINTAGKTNIDWCENNRDECYKNNVVAALGLAMECKALGIKYVFISSACIFQSKGIEDIKYEDSTPDPQCYYALTKATSERYLLDSDALILRIRLPISFKAHPRNSLSKILSYSKLVDSQESMTVIEDFLQVLKDLLENDSKGVYNIVNSGTISPHEIASIFGHDHEILSKESFDKMMEEQGRAKRVSTIVGSKRIPLLPDIRSRILDIHKSWYN